MTSARALLSAAPWVAAVRYSARAALRLLGKFSGFGANGGSEGAVVGA